MSTMRHSISFALLLAGLSGLTDAQEDATHRVDAIFAEWDRRDSPGCAVGVNGEDSLLYVRGYGSANLDYAIPLGAKSVFYLASVSKQFTAAAVAVAARRGLLSLDDDIRRWLPELREYQAPITIRHLVHHTSGLRDYLTLLPLSGRRYEDVLSDDDLLDLVARQRALNFAPGSEFLYSNTGYVLLAEIIKRATGRSLREYANEQLFQPLGMHDTHFHDNAMEIVPNRVIGYARDSSGYRINHLFNFDKVGDGGLYSTVEDLARWDRALRRGTIGGPGLSNLLLERGVLVSGDTLPYAFGNAHNEYRGLRTVEHGGALAGFRTVLLRFQEAPLSVIVLCNHSAANPGALARRVAEIYIGDRMGPAPSARAPGGNPSRRQQVAAADSAGAPNDSAPAALRQYAGSYRSEELNATYEIVVQDSAIVIARPDRRRVPLRASGRDTFVAVGSSGLQLRFTRDGAGRPDGFLVDAGRVRGVVFTRNP